jgi:hypothetical protein
LSGLDFLTPAASLVVLTVVAPLAALVLAGRRADRARRAIGLSALPGRSLAPAAVALTLVCVAVGIASAQPVLSTREEARTRTDAAAWVVVDTSRSMLAAESPRASSRIVRARQVALEVRAALRDVPVGVASLSDRVLPHLFPSSDPQVFATTVATTIRPGQPPPAEDGPLGTDLTSLAALPRAGFFEPAHSRRAALVLTDGESSAAGSSTLENAFHLSPRTALVIVRIGVAGERVFDARGRPEPEYEPIDAAATMVRRVAAAADGRSFEEGEADAAARTLRNALGVTGPTEERGREERRRPLAPYVLAAAALPLAWLLRRRNLG